MTIEIEKIPGGLRVDGIELERGKCGCTSLAKCCYSWAKVKRKGDNIAVEAKMTTPETGDNFDWGYTVSKVGTTITVKVEDARDKEIFAGFFPPPASAWEVKGWQVVSQEGDREDGAVWRCAMCKWLYKEDIEGTPSAELPEDWACPVCKAPKGDFERIG